MADNIPLPASGVSASTDDDGTAHHQRVKLSLGKDGTFTGTVGGEARGSDFAVYVDPRPRAATQSQTSSGLTTSTTNYTNGDTVGAGWTFTDMARANGLTGRITAAVLLDEADVIAGYELWFASASITFGTDNAAPGVSDSDALKIVGRVTCSPVRDLGGCRISYTDYLSLPYLCDATSLYVYAVCLNDHNFFAAATNLKLRLFYELD